VADTSLAKQGWPVSAEVRMCGAVFYCITRYRLDIHAISSPNLENGEKFGRNLVQLLTSLNCFEEIAKHVIEIKLINSVFAKNGALLHL